MRVAQYVLIVLLTFAPALSSSLLSNDQVTWLAHALIFVPGYDYFHQLGTRHALEELISTGVALLCTSGLLGLCLADPRVRSSFVRMRTDQRGRWALTDVRTRIAAVMLVGIAAWAWMSPKVLLHESGRGMVGAATRFLDGSSIGQGIYFDGLAYLTVSALMAARLVFVPRMERSGRSR